MADLNKIVEQLSALTVMEAADLAKKLEETWGVSAAAPVAMAMPAGGAEAAAVEEKTEFDVILHPVDAAQKIQAIKVVREITGLGLAEAKALVESAPAPVKAAVSKAEAEDIKKKLEAIPAKAEIK